MLPIFSDRTRNLLLQSWPLVQQNKDALIDRIGAYFRAAEPGETENGEMVAMMLVELMIGQSRHLLRFDELCGRDEIGPEHEALGISGRHYSRFGDVLVPVLEDLLGPSVPRAAAEAWCDAFWAIIRAVRAGRPGTAHAAFAPAGRPARVRDLRSKHLRTSNNITRL
jgi:hemoglobin-like flavoprotein